MLQISVYAFTILGLMIFSNMLFGHYQISVDLDVMDVHNFNCLFIILILFSFASHS